jgi:hypothetical protein
MSIRAATAVVLALAVPGAGHLFLGRRGRALGFFLVVVSMFAIGVAVDGGLYTVATSRGAMLRVLASYASMGSGLVYVLARLAGPVGNVASGTYEYGTTFMLTAGLMNLLLMLDCYDIAVGRKL